MKRQLRILNIVIHGKFKLSKRIRRKIIINKLYQSVITCAKLDKCFLNLEEFDREITIAQSGYYKSIIIKYKKK